MLLGVVPTAGTARRGAEAVSDRLFWFFTAVIAVQGGHMFEHVVQVLQVYAFGVPDDDALGLLGYLLQFNGTEEWLHLVFNVVYLASLYALVVPLRSSRCAASRRPSSRRGPSRSSSSAACGSRPGTSSSTA